MTSYRADLSLIFKCTIEEINECVVYHSAARRVYDKLAAVGIGAVLDETSHAPFLA